MFYHYHQNNSGGSFTFVDGALTTNVVIEANSPAEADSRLEDLGGYFDGCDSGFDCPCCGDRWYAASDYDGSEVPSFYSTPLDTDTLVLPGKNNMQWQKDGRPELYVHYLDGTVVGYTV